MTPAARHSIAILLLALTSAAQEPPTTTIEGRVTDTLGEALPAAEVWVTDPDDLDAEPRRRTVCDGEGVFRLGRVPQRPAWHLHARLDGHEHAVRLVSSAGHPEHVLLELRDAVTVRGVVRDAAPQGVAGQVVRAWSLDGGDLLAPVDAATGADGGFTLENVAIGSQRIVAFVPGAGFATKVLTVTEDCEVTLDPSDVMARGPITVQAVGIAPDDLAAARVRCGLTHRMRELPMPPPHTSLRLDADGSLTLSGAYGGALAVRLDAPGYVVSPRTRWLADKQPAVDLEFDAIAKGGQDLALRGTLRSPDGAPLAGVALAMTATDGSRAAFATTDDDGTFVFDSALPRGERCVFHSLDGRFLLESRIEAGARHPRLLRCESTVATRDLLMLRAVEAAAAAGTVRLPDGRPAAGARVRIEEQIPAAESGWVEVACAVTDRDGSYRSDRVHPRAQALRLVVDDARGAATGEPFAVVTDGDRTARCDLRLGAACVVEGTLVAADGSPLVAERVYLAHMRGRGRFAYSVVDHASRRLTDRRGRFRFRVQTGTGPALHVVASGAKSAPIATDVGGVQPIELVRHD